MKYVALLRGINVGGNRKVPMATLKSCLEGSGLKNVRTYIQSGNVLFESNERDQRAIEAKIEKCFEKNFGFQVPTVVLSDKELRTVLADIPDGWNKNPEWKYNYIFLKSPYDEKELIEGIGSLKPEIEAMTIRPGIIYQSMSIKKFGSTAGGKIAGKPIYKLMTIRNHNTVTKLSALINEQ